MPALAPQYVARKPLKVGGVLRQPGELVPEAAAWPNLRAYLATKQLELVRPKAPPIEGEKVAMASVQTLAPPAPAPSPKSYGKRR